MTDITTDLNNVSRWIAELPADRRVPWSTGRTSLVIALARLSAPPRAVVLNGPAWAAVTGDQSTFCAVTPEASVAALRRGLLGTLRLPDVPGTTELWGTTYLHPSDAAHGIWTDRTVPQLVVLA